MTKLVVIESPYAGDVEENVKYARACMADSFKRGEYPFASHLLYTQPGILDDNIPEERRLGIEANLEWGDHAKVRAYYVDRGISRGMFQAHISNFNKGWKVKEEIRELDSLRGSGRTHKMLQAMVDSDEIDHLVACSSSVSAVMMAERLKKMDTVYAIKSQGHTVWWRRVRGAIDGLSKVTTFHSVANLQYLLATRGLASTKRWIDHASWKVDPWKLYEWVSS